MEKEQLEELRSSAAKLKEESKSSGTSALLWVCCAVLTVLGLADKIGPVSILYGSALFVQGFLWFRAAQEATEKRVQAALLSSILEDVEKLGFSDE